MRQISSSIESGDVTSLAIKLRYGLLRSPARHVLKSLRGLAGRKVLLARNRLAAGLADDPVARALAADLNRDGYVRLDAVVSREQLDSLDRAAHSVAQMAGAKAAGHVTTKSFWTRLLDAELVDGKFPADSPYVRFAVQPGILRVLSTALGSVPLLDYVLLTRSHYTPEPLAQSQLWHRDYDDTRTIKVFAYLTDVCDRGDGPFTFVPGPQSDTVGFTLKSHLSDDKAFRRMPGAEPIEMIAPRLSVFAVETSRCLHMGSRLEPDRSRLLYTATFTSFPRIFGDTTEYFALTGDEAELERAVLAPVSWAAAL